MPSTIKFLGASVIGMNSKIGWGQAPSEIKVDLVEDTENGDAFNPHGIGGAVSLSLGSLSFEGLLKKYTYDTSVNGRTYSVIVSDPRHLLDASKLILSDYNLAVTGIYQLFNIFGYYENSLGYGGSQANSTGMPWEMVRDGLLTICNGGVYTSYGGPITYRGFKYTLNLTELPPLPSYFRVGGYSHGLSILDFIQICCDAANYDYFIRLSGTTIVLKTVARLNAYPLGTIGSMITSTFDGRVIRSSVGVEERADTTSSFIIGGNVHTLYQATPAYGFESSFWGFYPLNASDGDPDNLQPIIGSVDQAQRWANFYSSPDNSIYSYPVKRYRIYIDSPSISSYVGSTFYTTNDLELQVILGIGQTANSFTSWQMYLYRANNSLYQQINLTNTAPNVIQPPVGGRSKSLPNNTVNTTRSAVNTNTAVRTGTLIETGAFRMKAVYDFLANYARTYYGRKWAINIPGVTRKLDTESGKIGYSHEIADGGWVDVLDGNDLYGLPVEAYHRFQTQDGRFQSFAIFDGSTIDISRVNISTSYQRPSGSLYNKITLDNRLYFDASGLAYAIIDCDPVYDYPNSIVGLSGVVGALYLTSGISIESFEGNVTPSGQNYLRGLLENGAQNSTPIVTHPKPREPSGFQIAFKSNILTYGPWYAQGASGHINYSQDTSLVPWNYGGYTNLDYAANAAVSDGISNIQVIEAGYVEVEGLPEYDIGDIIEANGPNITDISVDIGKQGYTTTYRFETYVPRPGQLGKYNVDRLKRLNVASIEMNRKIRNRAELAQVQGAASSQAIAGNLPFQRLLHNGIVQNSPANMIVSRVIDYASGQQFPVVSFAKLEEVAGLVPSGVTEYGSFAACSAEALFSPYNIYASANGYLPNQSLNTSINPTGIITSINLTPWLDTNNSGYTCKYYGKAGVSGYEDLNDYSWTTNPASSGVPKQVIGMRGPLVLTGWGYDLHGAITPTAETRLTDVATHKVGPVDLLWDDYRKIWTSHDILKGITEAPIASRLNGSVGLYQGDDDTNINFDVYNWSDFPLPSGCKVNFGYNAHDNKWYVLNNDDKSYHFGVSRTNITAASGNYAGVGEVLVYSLNTDGSFSNTGSVIYDAYNLCSQIASGWWVNLHKDPLSQKWIVTPRCEKEIVSDTPVDETYVTLECGETTIDMPRTLCLLIENYYGAAAPDPGTIVGCVDFYATPLQLNYTGLDVTDTYYTWSGYETSGDCVKSIYLQIAKNNCDYILLGGFLGWSGSFELIGPTEGIIFVDEGYTLGVLPNLVFSSANDNVSQAGKYTVSTWPCGGGDSSACDVTVSFDDYSVAIDNTTITIIGTGFSTTPGNNTVSFNLGAVGSVTSATTTSLTVTLSTQPTMIGSLAAVVTVGDCNSGSAVQVAEIVWAVCEDAQEMFLGDGFGLTVIGGRWIFIDSPGAGTYKAHTSFGITLGELLVYTGTSCSGLTLQGTFSTNSCHEFTVSGSDSIYAYLVANQEGTSTVTITSGAC